MKITNIKFLAFEFDFGYSETGEERENLGRIDAEVFIEVEEDSGEKNTITHRTRLDGASFSDFTGGQEAAGLGFGGSFDTALQKVRELVALKVASDLGAELADMEYIPTQPLRQKVSELEAGLLEMSAISALQEQKANENEQAILELTMLMAGGM